MNVLRQPFDRNYVNKWISTTFQRQLALTSTENLALETGQ